MTTDAARYEQGPVSVDGGWFALLDGEWKQVANPNPPGTATPAAVPEGDFEEGPVSVDGAWFARVEGEWKQVGFVAQPSRPGRTIPEEYLSVDGALMRIESTISQH